MDSKQVTLEQSLKEERKGHGKYQKESIQTEAQSLKDNSLLAKGLAGQDRTGLIESGSGHAQMPWG